MIPSSPDSSVAEATINYLVSTDLDGTLLDHHHYDWTPALPAIALLKRHHIPIIFNTSKTLTEALSLQKQMGIDDPLIIENGSAIAIPNAIRHQFANLDQIEHRIIGNHTVCIFGTERSVILAFIAKQRAQFGRILEGYADWSLDIVAAKTGLSIAEARHSIEKHFSEPFTWLGGPHLLKTFKQNAHNENLKILQGGRFYHLQGNTTKAKPLLWLKHHWRRFASPPSLICLGDNNNDVDMLNIADYPVCIKSPTAPYPDIQPRSQPIWTTHCGPRGWHQAITQIIQNIIP